MAAALHAECTGRVGDCFAKFLSTDEPLDSSAHAAHDDGAAHDDAAAARDDGAAHDDGRSPAAPDGDGAGSPAHDDDGSPADAG